MRNFLKIMLIMVVGLVLFETKAYSSVTSTDLENIRTGDVYLGVDGVRRVYIGPDYASRGLKLNKHTQVIWGGDANTYTYNTAGELAGGVYVADASATQNSSLATSVATTRAETAQLVTNISSRISSVMDGSAVIGGGPALAFYESGTGSSAQKGMSAGDQSNKFGIWAMMSYSKVTDDNVATKFSGNIYSFTLGLDHKFTDELLLGLAADYTTMKKAKTDFNFGTLTHDNYSIMPYVAYRIDEMFSVDGIAGYTRLNKKTTRQDVIIINDVVSLAPGAQTHKASPKASRTFIGAYGNVKYPIDDFSVLFRVGYLYAQETQKAFSESDGTEVVSNKTKLGNASARLRGGYKINEYCEPFLQVGYGYDAAVTKLAFRDGPSGKNNKKHSYMFGGGINLFSLDNQLTGGVEVQHNRAGDGKVKLTTVLGKIRYQF